MDSHDRAWSWWYLLLLLQFVPALWVPFYNFPAKPPATPERIEAVLRLRDRGNG